MTTPPQSEILGESLVIDIHRPHAGLGHVLDAVGAGHVGDKQRRAVRHRGVQQAGRLGMDRAAGAADAGVPADLRFYGIRPVIDAGQRKFRAGRVFPGQRRRHLVRRVFALLHDIDGGLHKGVGIEGHFCGYRLDITLTFGYICVSPAQAGNSIINEGTSWLTNSTS